MRPKTMTELAQQREASKTNFATSKNKREIKIYSIDRLSICMNKVLADSGRLLGKIDLNICV